METCTCAKEWAEIGAHFANCKWLLSLSEEELAKLHPDSENQND
jgi:hypothetical protein